MITGCDRGFDLHTSAALGRVGGNENLQVPAVLGVGKCMQFARTSAVCTKVTACLGIEHIMFHCPPPQHNFNSDSFCSIIELTYGAEPFLRSCKLCSHSRTSQHFMEPAGSLPCSQEPSTAPYLQPDRSSPYHPTLSKIYFNTVHPHAAWSS
jgi:hypothetical protein